MTTPTNTPCPKCGSYKTNSGYLTIAAMGGVFVLIGIIIRVLIPVGFLFIAIAIIGAILEKINGKTKFLSCADCKHNRLHKKDLQEEVKRL